jgi:hypothetical protein
LRNAFNEIAPAHVHAQRLVQRKRAAELNLDLFGGAFANQQIIFALHELRDGVVHRISGGAHCARVNNAAQTDHRDVRGAATNVNNDVALRFSDRESSADSRRDCFFHEINL